MLLYPSSHLWFLFASSLHCLPTMVASTASSVSLFSLPISDILKAFLGIFPCFGLCFLYQGGNCSFLLLPLSSLTLRSFVRLSMSWLQRHQSQLSDATTGSTKAGFQCLTINNKHWNHFGPVPFCIHEWKPRTIFVLMVDTGTSAISYATAGGRSIKVWSSWYDIQGYLHDYPWPWTNATTGNGLRPWSVRVMVTEWQKMIRLDSINQNKAKWYFLTYKSRNMTGVLVMQGNLLIMTQWLPGTS